MMHVAMTYGGYAGAVSTEDYRAPRVSSFFRRFRRKTDGQALPVTADSTTMHGA